MKIKRIVPNIATKDVEAAKRFYCGALGLDVAIDMGWIMTFEADASMSPQLSVARRGGSDTALPDVSIEVDDLDEALSPIILSPISRDRATDVNCQAIGTRRRFFSRLPTCWS
jgi:predicted enzyme related to lactoylglutathione lyase